MNNETDNHILLHCLIITYNRSIRLKRTLEYFVNHSFSDLRITVLDNCSTDQTPEIIDSFRNRIANYDSICHKYNIGLSGNIMRAMEISSGHYTWILSDDDQLDILLFNEILEILRKKKIDLISLSCNSRPSYTGGNFYTVHDFIEKDLYFFRCFTFLSNTIFKTTLIDSNVVHQGIRKSHTLLPQFPLLIKIAQENHTIYCSKQEVVTRRMDDPPSWPFSQLWLGWAECCHEIKSTTLKNAALKDIFQTKRPLWQILPYVILLARARNEPKPGYYIQSLQFLPTSSAITGAIACLISLLPYQCLYFAFRILSLSGKHVNLVNAEAFIDNGNSLRS